MLEVIDVTVHFGTVRALDGVSLDVQEGEVVALLGPSGSGKSTLLHVVAGLIRPQRGEVRWEGTTLGPRAPHTRGFGLMFQDYALFPHLDVTENVRFGLRMAGVPDDVAAGRVVEMLDLVGLTGYEHRSIDALSGGERQRVALARALAPNPRLLMLDEPIGALDQSLRARLLGDLRGLLADIGTPAIYVTHDQAEAFELADRVAVMSEGRILQVDPPEQLWRHPASEAMARFLGHENLVTVRAQGGVLATPWGAIPSDLPDGQHLVSVPAAAVRVGAGEIPATVADTRFRAGHSRVELTALNQPIVADVTGPAPEPGTKVRVQIDSSRLIVIPPGTGG